MPNVITAKKRRKISLGKIKKLFIRAGARCEICNSKRYLYIHHIYGLGHENLDHLKVICRPCHFKEHNQVLTNDYDYPLVDKVRPKYMVVEVN